MKIINALLQLKRVLAEEGGEISQITLDDNAIKAIRRECSLSFPMFNEAHRVCPHCFEEIHDKLLGIEIWKSADGGFFSFHMANFLNEYKSKIIEKAKHGSHSS